MTEQTCPTCGYIDECGKACRCQCHKCVVRGDYASDGDMIATRECGKPATDPVHDWPIKNPPPGPPAPPSLYGHKFRSAVPPITPPPDVSRNRCIRLTRNMCAGLEPCDLPANAPVHLRSDGKGGHPFETFTSHDASADEEAWERFRYEHADPVAHIVGRNHIKRSHQWDCLQSAWDAALAHARHNQQTNEATRPPFDVDKVAEEIANEVNQAIFAYTGCGVAQLAGMNVLGITEKHLHRAINGETR